MSKHKAVAKTRKPIPQQATTERTEPADSEQPDPASESVADPARQRMVAEAAYYRAQKRGFAPGAEAEDWLQAEAEVLEKVRASHTRP